MKKFLTLTLVFVMVLAFAMPALAFTDKVPAETVKVPYTLDIYLVEAEDEDEFGMAVYTLPPSDRGYAKNEIICAVAKLFIPKEQYPVADDGYRNFNMIGKNVRLATIDNLLFMKKSTNWTAELEYQWDLVGAPTGLDTLNDDIEYSVNPGKVLDNSATPKPIDGATEHTTGAKKDAFYNTKDKTYAASFFGKVTGDDAFMAVEFTKGLEFEGASNEAVLIFGDYIIIAVGTAGKDETFIVYDKNGVALFRIETAKGNASKALSIAYDGIYAAGPDIGWSVSQSGGEFVFSGMNGACINATTGNTNWPTPTIDRLNAQSVAADKNAAAVHAFMVDMIENGAFADLGFSWDNIGNVVNRKTFEDIAAADDLYAEVAVLPWYAYVEVPPAITVDPPKTGDVMSVVGFALIALSALAVVAIRKVRA